MNKSMIETKNLITLHKAIVNFGSSADAVAEDWIVKAEETLRRTLPESYKWFLREYAGGEIGGEEIYSIYGLPFESVNGGDIVFQHLNNLRSGLLDDSKLVISETDLGETFFFDYEKFHNAECPVFLRVPSGDFVYYANDFYDFLSKRIYAHSS